MYRAITAFAIASIGASQLLSAQRLTDALLGSRVRLETTNGQVIGTLVALDADTARVVARDPGNAMAVPRSAVLSYDVSSGRERGRGAKRGALAGGALGLAVIVASLRRDTATVNRQPSDLRVAVPIGVGLLALGAAIGSALAPERWEASRRLASGARMRILPCPGQCAGLQFRY